MGTQNSKSNEKSNENLNGSKKQRTISSSSSTVSYKARTSSLPAFLRCVSDNEKKKRNENPPFSNKPFQIKKTSFEDDYVFTHSRLGSGASSRSGGGVFLCLRRSDQIKFAVKVNISQSSNWLAPSLRWSISKCFHFVLSFRK